MDEDAAMVAQVHFVEIVHVELSHKGGETVVSEVLWQDYFLELLLVEDADALVFGVPIDDLGVFFGLN